MRIEAQESEKIGACLANQHKPMESLVSVETSLSSQRVFMALVMGKIPPCMVLAVNMVSHFIHACLASYK